MPQRKPESAVDLAEAYYDSEDADTFYREIWGGEDIHIGFYEPPDLDIAAASLKTVEAMARHLDGIGADARVLDIGSGYGGAARHLARTRGLHVACLNLSDVQNAYNQQRNRAAKLDGLVRVVHGNFEKLPFENCSFDVVWSQDAILHSGNRRRVLEEVARVLKPGGRFVFTDPMQADGCPDGVLQPILDRIHLASLASPAFYRRELEKLGFATSSFEELTQHLRTHYDRIGAELVRRRGEIETKASKAYVDRMLQGLRNWVDGADRGHLAWGIFRFDKP
ncbi:MAG: methyltransferase domain-containing protein [Hyphomicrobiaceae bacterium]|nr:methyltransferase domain-containing protein [Hyphomicrobiaceae bacterium]